MTTGRINQVAALQNADKRHAQSAPPVCSPRPPGRACFECCRVVSVRAASRPANSQTSGPPRRHSCFRVTRFLRCPLVGLPGVKQPTIRKDHMRCVRVLLKAHDTEQRSNPQAAPSREPPSAAAHKMNCAPQKRAGSSLRFGFVVTFAHRAFAQARPLRAQTRPKPAGAQRRAWF